MSEFTNFVLGLLLFLSIIAPLVAWLIIKRLALKDVTDTIIIFDDTSRTNGVSIANLIKKEVGKSGRIKMTYFPRDVEKPKPQIIILESNKVEIRPKGLHSAERNIIKILPENSLTYNANAFAKIEMLNAENHIILAQKTGLERQQAHLDELGEGELSREDIALKNSYVESLLKQKTKDERGGSSAPYKPGTYFNPNASNRDLFT